MEGECWGNEDFVLTGNSFGGVVFTLSLLCGRFLEA